MFLGDEGSDVSVTQWSGVGREVRKYQIVCVCVRLEQTKSGKLQNREGSLERERGGDLIFQIKLRLDHGFESGIHGSGIFLSISPIFDGNHDDFLKNFPVMANPQPSFVLNH
jgi:hypothetical protein